MKLACEMACARPVGETPSAALIRYSPAYREAYRRAGFEIVDTIGIGKNTAFPVVPAARETAAGCLGPHSEKEG